MDADGIDFAAELPGGGEVPVRLPFGHRLSQRAEVRQEVVRWHRQARTLLGHRSAR